MVVFLHPMLFDSLVHSKYPKNRQTIFCLLVVFWDKVSFCRWGCPGTQYIAQSCLKLTILLYPPPKCLDYRNMLVCLAVFLVSSWCFMSSFSKKQSFGGPWDILTVYIFQSVQDLQVSRGSECKSWEDMVEHVYNRGFCRVLPQVPSSGISYKQLPGVTRKCVPPLPKRRSQLWVHGKS